ncbi:4Fe-4S binding protein [Acetanaerobacterium elongatum]|uniref:4Fe-4S binding domain-containing protein n=1 Tax=Acetanaerobacterium elongatum TaxID=258515 RepID=A0A1H0DGW9_9FIRM|nr:4Fe-4S binding protein [Acetanaerobacterium elongatum]SDN69276.1 4Fe-4S binding domain-containing protein [Acetanaerobacterium elongatum]
MNKPGKGRWIRPTVQITFLMIVLLTAVGKGLKEAGFSLPFFEEASLHAICPFGGVETLYSLFADGRLIQKIHSASVILMLAVLVISLLFGPAFCGWICPFGTFQEYIGKIGKRLLGKRYNNLVPGKLDSILRYLRYGVLALVLYNTAVTAKLVFQNADPYYALFNMFSNEVAVTAYIALAVIAALSLVAERPFCKYACPYGAVLGLFNLVRIFKIKRNAATCTGCKSCDRSCPMNIEVSKRTTVYNHQCISCLQCTSENGCVRENTVALQAGRQK